MPLQLYNLCAPDEAHKRVYIYIIVYYTTLESSVTLRHSTHVAIRALEIYLYHLVSRSLLQIPSRLFGFKGQLVGGAGYQNSSSLTVSGRSAEGPMLPQDARHHAFSVLAGHDTVLKKNNRLRVSRDIQSMMSMSQYDYGLMESHGRSPDATVVPFTIFYPLHRSPWKFVPGTMSSTSCCSPSAPQQATGHDMSEDSEAVSGQLHFKVRRDTERFCVYRTYSNKFQPFPTYYYFITLYYVLAIESSLDIS